MAIQPHAGIREERGSVVGVGIENEISAVRDDNARIAVHDIMELHGKRGRDRGEGGEWLWLVGLGVLFFGFLLRRPSVD